MDSNEKRVVCVITRYNEKLDWVNFVLKFVDFIYIYNKGDNEDMFDTPLESTEKIEIIKLPNIGRIDHTIAYHIDKYIDNLPERLIFIPGSILLCRYKERYLEAILKRINLVKERFNGFYSPRFHIVSKNFNYNIDDYKAESNCNRNDNKFIKSDYADFQEWKKALIDTRDMRYVAMRGMFIVCKENILHIDKKIYKTLIENLSIGDNIENGHFAERIWAHLFRQYSFDKLIKID